jgi:hypothetical protein
MKWSAKKRVALPKWAAIAPQRRVPETSLRAHANPCTGRFGCSDAGASPPAPRWPRKLRTCSTSPNGTPVCAIPNGPGFMAEEHDSLARARVGVEVGGVGSARVVERIVDARHRRSEAQPRDVAGEATGGGAQRAGREQWSWVSRGIEPATVPPGGYWNERHRRRGRASPARGRAPVGCAARAIFRGLSCRFPRGKISVILGGSGAGKSTLLRAIGGPGATTARVSSPSRESRSAGFPSTRSSKSGSASACCSSTARCSIR